MEETLTQQRRVKDEGPRIVNFCPWGKINDGTQEENPGKLRASSRGDT